MDESASTLLSVQCGPLAEAALPLASICCCVACACFCPLSHALANVAVSLTCLATILATCSRAGVLGWRGFAVERVGTRIFREKVSQPMCLRDLDLLVPNVYELRGDGEGATRSTHIPSWWAQCAPGRLSWGEAGGRWSSLVVDLRLSAL